eukprot:1080192-Pelagomonas_calceolata.AAC.2
MHAHICPDILFAEAACNGFNQFGDMASNYHHTKRASFLKARTAKLVRHSSTSAQRRGDDTMSGSICCH